MTQTDSDIGDFNLGGLLRCLVAGYEAAWLTWKGREKDRLVCHVICVKFNGSYTIVTILEEFERDYEVILCHKRSPGGTKTRFW